MAGEISLSHRLPSTLNLIKMITAQKEKLGEIGKPESQYQRRTGKGGKYEITRGCAKIKFKIEITHGEKRRTNENSGKKPSEGY